MRRHPQVLSRPLLDPVTRDVPLRLRANRAASALPGFIRLAFVAALASGLLACKTADETPRPSAAAGAVARLGFAGGSAASGSVRFQPFAGGTVVIANVFTGKSGRWRAVIHATGNCTSANAFSAGAPLLVPGFAAPIEVPITTDVAGSGATTVRIAGLAIDGPAGINGRSVVLHAGAAGPLDAQPGVPNDRFACGVIETVRPLF